MEKGDNTKEDSPILPQRECVTSQGGTNYGAIPDDEEVQDTSFTSQSPKHEPKDTGTGEANKAFETEEGNNDSANKNTKTDQDKVNSSVDTNPEDTKSIAPSIADSEAPLVNGEAGVGIPPASAQGSGPRDGEAEGGGQRGEVEEAYEPWWRILGEVTVPFILAGFGMVVAGYVLGEVQVISSTHLYIIANSV